MSNAKDTINSGLKNNNGTPILRMKHLPKRFSLFMKLPYSTTHIIPNVKSFSKLLHEV